MWSQTLSLSSERLCWQSQVDVLQDWQISVPWRDVRMQRAGKIGKTIDFDISSFHISKEEKCTDNCTFLIRCFQRFPEQYTYQRWQYQQSPQQKDLYLSKVISSIVASLSAWFLCSSMWVVLYLFLLQNFSTSRYLQMYFSPHWSFCGIYSFPDCWNPRGSKQHFNFYFFPTTGSGNRDFTWGKRLDVIQCLAKYTDLGMVSSCLGLYNIWEEGCEEKEGHLKG